MTELVDLHCHVLPYVDDGAERKEESHTLLEMQYAQGVRTVCCTPHLRHGMFETPDEVIREQFERLKGRANEARTLSGMRFYLSREYYCDKGFLEKLEKGEVLPLGEGRHLLVEFSRHSEEKMHEYLDLVQRAGYEPLVAHAERYPALAGDTAKVAALIERGARIQMNAGSILGREGLRQSLWAKKLLKAGLVHVIASDAHDPDIRPPELDLCARFLTRKFGDEQAEKLLCANPMKILLGA